MKIPVINGSYSRHNSMKEKKENSARKQDPLRGLDLSRTEDFAVVYDFFSAKIWRHIYLRTSNPEDTNDLIAQVFTKTWEYVKTGKRIKNIKPFLYKTANNLFIDWYRARQKVTELQTELSGEEHENLLVQEDGSRQLLTSLASQAEISQALNKIAIKDKELLIMRFVEELEISEIAEILGKSRGTTAVALHRALKSLEKILNNHAGEL